MSILDSFKLVELITTRTDAVVTIGGGNNIKFNAATHVDLDYPAYIQMFVDEKGKKFAIKVLTVVVLQLTDSLDGGVIHDPHSLAAVNHLKSKNQKRLIAANSCNPSLKCGN